jgi:hypothetical protein
VWAHTVVSRKPCELPSFELCKLAGLPTGRHSLSQLQGGGSSLSAIIATPTQDVIGRLLLRATTWPAANRRRALPWLPD